MTTTQETNRDKRAAIICSHVAIGGFPILRAVRDEPTMPEDSGWQFLCGNDLHDESDEARVWLVFEVVDHEPSLQPHVELPPGTVLTRSDNFIEWKIESR